MPIKLFFPRFWVTWIGVGLLRLSILLPWKTQMFLGKYIGLILYKVLSSRRKVSCINLEIAFPSFSPKKREELNRQHFISLGEGIFSTALSWWGKESMIQGLSEIEGLEYLLKANKNSSVILVGGHFTSMELGGRILAAHTRLHTVYRPHQNELLEYLTTKKRSQHYGKIISKYSIKEMIKSLKTGKIVWYATDQNYRGKNSIDVPFFGVDGPTNPGTSRLSKMTKANVIPIFPLKKEGKEQGYLLRILPPLDNFPSGDSYEDTLRLNKIIENQIKNFPEQYLWTHKRYKNYDNNNDFYKNYIKTSSSSSC